MVTYMADEEDFSPYIRYMHQWVLERRLFLLTPQLKVVRCTVRKRKSEAE